MPLHFCGMDSVAEKEAKSAISLILKAILPVLKCHVFLSGKRGRSPSGRSERESVCVCEFMPFNE